jgi:hypothetical protein
MRTAHTLLLAGTAALLAAAGACYDDDAPAPTGPSQSTRVYLTDAPFPFDSVDAVEIYIHRIDFSEQTDTTGGSGGGWVTVATPRRRVNLLDYQNGDTVLVGQSTIPAGQYRAVRMVIDTDSSRIVGRNGAELPVEWQSSSGRPTLHALVEAALDVPSAGAAVVIDFDVGRSFVQQAPGTPFIFLPWFRAVNSAATGSVQGTVVGRLLDGTTEPIRNAAVTLYRVYGDEEALITAATARTDAQGAYKAAFLMPGTYLVRAEAPGARTLANGTVRFFHEDTRPAVSVAQGLATAASFALSELSRSFIGIEGRFTLAPGDTTELTATVSDAAGALVTNPQVAWTTSNEAVATVAGSGRTARVAGIAAGSATITARSGTLVDTAVVIVSTGGSGGGGGGGGPSGAVVASLSMNPASLGVALGDTAVFVATARDANNQILRDRPVAWTVSDSSVAQLVSSPTGPQYVVLRGRQRGSVTVRATVETKTATGTLTVQ